jgi:hypothetical protein
MQKKPTKFDEMMQTWGDGPVDKVWINDYKRKSSILSPGELITLKARAQKLIAQPGIVQLNGKTYVYTPVRWFAWLMVLPVIWLKIRMNQIIKEYLHFIEAKQRRVLVSHTFFEPKGATDPFTNPAYDKDGNFIGLAGFKESLDAWQKREEARFVNRVKRAFLKVVGGNGPVSFSTESKPDLKPVKWRDTDDHDDDLELEQIKKEEEIE